MRAHANSCPKVVLMMSLLNALLKPVGSSLKGDPKAAVLKLKDQMFNNFYFSF